MSRFPEYDRYDALGLADLVRQGQITPLELCEEAIERIEQVNPKINAVVTRMYEQGRRRLRKHYLADRLPGFPFLLRIWITPTPASP